MTTGATKASINKGFSLNENLGDITAKGQNMLKCVMTSLMILIISGGDDGVRNNPNIIFTISVFLATKVIRKELQHT